MTRNQYDKTIAGAQKIIIKIGSSRLSGDPGKINDFLFSLVSDIRYLTDQGKQIVVVSSGAIACGKEVMMGNHTISSPSTISLPEKQAYAAIGQSQLMKLYESFFSKVNLAIAQILFGYPQIKDKSSFQNLQNTFRQLLAWNVLPIVNENDSIATEELKLGDNDILSSLVAIFLQADLLVILTGVDGFIKNNQTISYLPAISQQDWQFARGPEGPGTGGMLTKLQAADVLSRHGIPCAIINGKKRHNIRELIDHNQTGTLIGVQNKNRYHSDEEIIEILAREYKVTQMEVGI